MIYLKVFSCFLVVFTNVKSHHAHLMKAHLVGKSWVPRCPKDSGELLGTFQTVDLNEGRIPQGDCGRARTW